MGDNSPPKVENGVLQSIAHNAEAQRDTEVSDRWWTRHSLLIHWSAELLYQKMCSPGAPAVAALGTNEHTSAGCCTHAMNAVMHSCSTFADVQSSPRQRCNIVIACATSTQHLGC